MWNRWRGVMDAKGLPRSLSLTWPVLCRRETGFRTVNILSFPVRQRHGGKVVAVIQMLNKDGGFTPGDVSVRASLPACHGAVRYSTAEAFF